MTTFAERLGQAHMNLERKRQAGDFIMLGKAIAIKDFDATSPNASKRVRELLQKAPVVPANTTTQSALSDYDTIAGAFLESLRGISVFDTLLAGGMKVVPLKTRVAVASTAVTGSSVSEMQVKPISAMALTGADIAPRKAAAIIVVSEELLKLQSSSSLFADELRNGVIVATDTAFLAALYAGVTPTASAGSTTANVLTDLGVLLSALTLDSNSRVYMVISPANVAKLMLKQTTGTGVAFPLLALNGGFILNGIPVLVSSSVPTNAIIAIDATGLAGNTETPRLRNIKYGDVQLETSPSSPPVAATVWHSLWQHNEAALFCERYFGFAKVRAGTVAAISGAIY